MVSVADRAGVLWSRRYVFQQCQPESRHQILAWQIRSWWALVRAPLVVITTRGHWGCSRKGTWVTTTENSHELEQIQIAQRFADPAVPEFDRAGAEQAGLDSQFAREFERSFHNSVEELKNSSDPSHKQQDLVARGSLLPAWANCAIAIASLAGATVGAVAAIFASGGTLAFALATYGLSGAGVLGSCYDENGNPVV